MLKIRIFAAFISELLQFESRKTLDFYSFGCPTIPPINFSSYRISLLLCMNSTCTKKGCLHAEDKDICNISLEVITF